MESNTAIAILAHDRPLFLRCLLEQLRGQVDDIPVYLFLDGPDDRAHKSRCHNLAQKKMAYEWQQELFLHYFPTGVLQALDYNIGIGFNTLRAKEFIFSHYDVGIFFEDDIVISSNYIKLILEMESILASDPRVGWITAHADANRSESLQELSASYPNQPVHTWAWLSWKDKYQQAQFYLKVYYQIIKQFFYE